MKKSKLDYWITLLGIILLATGLFFVKSITNPQGYMLTLPYVCIGLGCGIFGHGMGNHISRKALKNASDVQKQIAIEKKDERNITIVNRAKAKAYDMMTFVFGALMISFALIGVDLIPVLLLVSAYLFVHGYGIFFHCKYEKEM